MKKIFLALIAAVLSFVSCDKEKDDASAADIVGSWKPVTVIDDIEEVGKEYDPGSYGIPTLWVFGKDGDFEWSGDRIGSLAGTWKLEGKSLRLTFDGNGGAAVFTVKTLTSSDMALEMPMAKGDTVTIKLKKL